MNTYGSIARLRSPRYPGAQNSFGCGTFAVRICTFDWGARKDLVRTVPPISSSLSTGRANPLAHVSAPWKTEIERQ